MGYGCTLNLELNLPWGSNHYAKQLLLFVLGDTCYAWQSPREEYGSYYIPEEYAESFRNQLEMAYEMSLKYYVPELSFTSKEFLELLESPSQERLEKMFQAGNNWYEKNRCGVCNERFIWRLEASKYQILFSVLTPEFLKNLEIELFGMMADHEYPYHYYITHERFCTESKEQEEHREKEQEEEQASLEKALSLLDKIEKSLTKLGF